MRRTAVWATVAALLGACAPLAQERAGELTRDGLQMYQQGAFREARDSFRAALADRPDDAQLLFHHAQCSDRMGQAELAEKGYRDCLQRDGGHAAARHALAELLVRRGRRGEAVQMAEDWLRAQPARAGPYALDGWLRAEAGDLVSARSRYQQALSRDPVDVHALVGLGRVYEKLNRPERALVLYERSLEANADQPEVRGRAAALRRQGTAAPRPD